MTQEHSGSSYRIVFGLIIGVVVGILMAAYVAPENNQWISHNITQPIGTLFLRSLFMIVVPLVAASLTAAVADLGNISNLGRFGRKAALFYLTTTLFAAVIGQVMVTTIQPGSGVDQQFIEKAKVDFQEQTSGLRLKSEGVNESLWPGIVEKVVPKNILEEWAATNMLAVIFVALLFGAALLKNPSPNTKTLVLGLHGISEATIQVVGWIMRIAPVAVACLMINAILTFKADILLNLMQYVLVVIAGYLVHFFFSYGLIVRKLLKMSPLKFYKAMLPVFLTAFSTSSSNATLPTTISHLKKRFGVPEHVVTFTAPLGATVNMDGTCLFEIVAAIFIAQVFGIDLTWVQQITLVVLIVISSIGVAGVPGGSIPLLMSAMASVGIPPEGIALVLGVDRLLDMGRTVVNVTGDAICALYLARGEGIDLEAELATSEKS